jgi:hypothetical protein
MPQTRICVFCDRRGKSDLLTWLKDLRRDAPAAHKKGQARIRLLALEGNALRRPVADYLRDGIYELRWRVKTVQYRVLYFFHDKCAATLSHGLTKEDEVPDDDIEQAIVRSGLVRRSPAKHTKVFEV